MDEKGVYAIARSVWDCDAFTKQKFTQREAWMWLIGAAVWKQVRLNLEGRWLILERGEFAFSLRFLAKKWKWSKDAVSRFFSLLKNEDMIRDTSRDTHKVYSINKYNEFQVVGLPRATDNETQSATAVRQPCDKEEALQTLQTLETLETLEVKKVEAPANAVAPRSKPIRGTRWPETQTVPPDWIAGAAEMRRQDNSPPIDLDYEARRFENYWAAKAGGAAALKVNWRRTWLNWATDKGKTGNGRNSGKKTGSAVDQHLAGIAQLSAELRQRRA